MENKRIQEVKLYGSLIAAEIDIQKRLRDGWHVYSCTAGRYNVLVVYEKQNRV